MTYNDLFLGYAHHLQELDDIAEYIMQGIKEGKENVSAECIDNLTDVDIQYIVGRLYDQGFLVELTRS